MVVAVIVARMTIIRLQHISSSSRLFFDFIFLAVVVALALSLLLSSLESGDDIPTSNTKIIGSTSIPSSKSVVVLV